MVGLFRLYKVDQQQHADRVSYINESSLFVLICQHQKCLPSFGIWWNRFWVPRHWIKSRFSVAIRMNGKLRCWKKSTPISYLSFTVERWQVLTEIPDASTWWSRLHMTTPYAYWIMFFYSFVYCSGTWAVKVVHRFLIIIFFKFFNLYLFTYVWKFPVNII